MQRLNCFEKTLCNFLKGGQIPEHIGFIMDGNRMHAKKLKLGDPIKGHVEGVRSLKKCLLICRQIRVKMVSLYCFSIENFKRSQGEVEGLMKLFLDTFDECSTLTKYLNQEQIKVNIVGNVTLFRSDIQECIRKIEERTKSYNKMIINMCFGYDSLWESQESIAHMQKSSYQEFMNNLSIKMPLDILVRTANEKRLSNFMLPQCVYCHVYVLKEHWPQLSIISFIKLILDYNYYFQEINQQKRKILKELSTEDEKLQNEDGKSENEQQENLLSETNKQD